MTRRGVFVGLSTIDVVYGVDQFPQPNAKTAANDQDVFIGGPATNASITFSLLGGRPTLVTAVGRHAMASLIRRELRQCSVRLIDLNPDFADAPVVSSVSVDGRGNRTVVSANAKRVPVPPAQVNLTVCARASVVLVDGHYMEACQAWARAARSQEISVVLDGGSWKSGTEELIENVDTAICSADFRPPGCASENDVFDYLRDRGVKNIAITRGAEPVLFASGESKGSVRVPQVKAVDTMGAGDVFHGAFCYYASTGLRFDASLAAAAKVAAESCRFRGPRGWTESSKIGQERKRERSGVL
jgi:sugar/nucleoside kinase (ribokinase family)